jgi:phosphomannomutase
VFAGEVSGHYYFSDFWGVDTGIVPALMLLQLVSEAGGSLASLIRPLRDRYHLSGEINSRVDDVEGAIARILEQYSDAAISKIDGINVDYDDWHFNVRSSNTEPLLRLNLEAYDAIEMERRRDEVLGLIRAGSEQPVGAGH